MKSIHIISLLIMNLWKSYKTSLADLWLRVLKRHLEQKTHLYRRYFDTHYMKRTGGCVQPMEGNVIVYDDITETGPPTSDAHLYRSAGLRQIHINAHTVTGMHAVYLTDSSGLIEHVPQEDMRSGWYQHGESFGERAPLRQRGEFVELISSVSLLLHQVHSVEDKLGGHVGGVRR